MMEKNLAYLTKKKKMVIGNLTTFYKSNIRHKHKRCLNQRKKAGTANKFGMEITRLSCQKGKTLDQPVHERKNSLTGP